jgi:prophage antirepressor-like protein
MNIRTEIWAGYDIRFIEKETAEWWAVAVDVTKALDIGNTTMALKRITSEDKALIPIEGISKGNDLVNVLSEFGIYDLVFSSHKPEAKEFKKWVFNIIKTLRQSSGIEGFQIFRMLDKDHQREAMRKLNQSLSKPVRVDFIKANTIANKAVSIQHGYPKMIKKDAMTPEMLVDRQPILEDAVNLMGLADKYNLDISVSKTIYNGLTNKQTG